MKRLVLTAALFAAGTARAQDVATVQVIELGAPGPAGAIRFADMTGKADTLVQADDYPAAAVAARAEGQVVAKLAIAADGKTNGCEIASSSKVVTNGTGYQLFNDPADASLSSAACAIATRGSFRHALGADGKPVAGAYLLMVNFLLKDPHGSQYFSPAPPPPGPWAMQAAAPKGKDALILRNVSAADFSEKAPRVNIGISHKGHATRCLIVTSSGTDAGDAALCRYMSSLKYEPARDRQGKKIATKGIVFKLTVQP